MVSYFFSIYMIKNSSNGLFPASRHKVVIPKDRKVAAKPRYSLVFFMQPDNDCVVEPLNGNDKKFGKTTSAKHLEPIFMQAGIKEY